MTNQEIAARIIAIAHRLKREYHAETVLLFGSHARNEASGDSDVDLFIIAATHERFFERMATVLELVRDLYNGLALSPIVLTPKEVEGKLEIGDQFVQEILETGVEL